MGKHSALIFFLLLSFTSISIHGQTPNAAIQQQARQELQRRGVDETAVRAKLQQRGIDIDNIQPEQLPALQPAIEQAIKEVEAEKAAQTPASTTPSMPTPTPAANAPTATGNQESAAKMRADKIQEKVKQGISVEEAISEELTTGNRDSLPPAQVYGQHLFRDQSLAVFRTTNEVKPPDSYILSSGDVITISIFGASQFDNQFEIKKDGYIQPSQLPKIFLKGLPLSQAKELLRSRFSQFYRFAPEQFAVSVTTARSITVNIFGETVHYGSFSLSAINTAFNALMAAGGPTDLGSVRNIQVIRGKVRKRLDIYAFMNNPAIQYDFFLEDNDIIQVPVAERVVGIRGAIRRPFRYELIEGEHLSKLLEYAGGLPANAYREVVQIQRFMDGKQVLLDVNLQELLTQKKDFTLLNGDEVVVRSITTPIENTARIEGAVELPGPYALTETRRVSDLLRKGVLRPEARRDVAFLLRTNPDQSSRLIQLNLTDILAAPGSAADLPLQAADRLSIYALERFLDQSTIRVVGAVRDSLIDYPYASDSTITLQRAILLAGGLRPDATGRGLILRTNPNNAKEKQYLEVDLATALAAPNSPSDLILQPFDQIEVLSQLTFSDAPTVRVTGAVRRPGEFLYGLRMNLREVLLLAGGLRLEAARNRIEIFRIVIQENEPTRTMVARLQVDSAFAIVGSAPENFAILPFDEIVVRTVPEFEFQRYVSLEGEVKYPGRYALISDNETLADLIQRAGGLTAEAFPEGATLYRNEGSKGYVVTELKEALRQHDSPHNHVLKEGDVVMLPKREDLVSLRTPFTQAAALYQERFLLNGLINAAYTPGKRAKWYIQEYAAGFAKRAVRSRVTVARPNGKISRTVNLGLFKIYPRVTKGSIISVGGRPEKEKRSERERKPIDWDKALTQILAVAGTLATVILATAALK